MSRRRRFRIQFIVVASPTSVAEYLRIWLLLLLLIEALLLQILFNLFLERREFAAAKRQRRLVVW